MKTPVALLLGLALLAACGPGDEPAPSFDYVVVGAGAAGSVLAHRLTEDPATRVLVLEAGSPDDDARIRRPSAFRQLLGTPFNWGESTLPEPHLNGREVSLPRGRGWGGGGSISAMVYVRGHAADFDRWEAAGNPGWGYDDVLPYFRKAEDFEGGPSEFHGAGGPQSVVGPRWVSPISRAFLEAALQAGIPANDDFNGPRQAGAGLYQLNQKDGQRHSAADAYLRPALGRENLTVESQARVTRVLFEGRRAVGVEYVQGGETREARAAREVVLSAGAIGSAQVLLLSGVGPAPALRELGIPVVKDLPGVGENLQDHPRVALTYASKRPLGLSDAERAQAEAEYEEARTGPLSSNGIGAGAFVRTDPQSPAPDIQIMLTANPAADTFSVHAALMHPWSRGAVRLRSADPSAATAIQVNYLADERDLETLARGLEVARRIAEAEALAPFRGEGLAPGPDGWGPEALHAHIRENVATFFHPVGTCRMGSDDRAVVDPALRVRGLEGLRVVDASVMPDLLSGATHAATVMIAEKGADLLKAARAEGPLPPRATVNTDAGGPLTPEQAAYDVRFYELDLAVDPEARTLDGSLTMTARMVEPAARIRLDLDDRLEVTAVERLGEGGEQAAAFTHEEQRLWVDLDPVPEAGEELRLRVRYGGSPREAPNPPWEGGFTWSTSADGSHWIGVSCQVDGSDLWWPSKDHPSDEPDDGALLRYTVPADLEVAANGVLAGVTDNGDGTRTWEWKVLSPINTYNVTFNAGPFEKLEADYESVAGETFPVVYWVLPEHLEEGRDLFAEMLEHLRFLEAKIGPFPFRGEKMGVVEAPYLGMEHQTVITYGGPFTLERFGFRFVAFHELGHEWWGNLVSVSDWRDFWIHEGFDGYTEALWVEEKLGASAYREYVARYLRPAIVNEYPAAPREERSIRQVYRPRPPAYTSVDVDAFAKGGLLLHTLRYLMGDEAFFTLLRRWAYPTDAHARATDGSQTRIVTTADFRALAEEIAGRPLGWLFDVYLHQPVLPRLESRVEEGRLHLTWRLPEGLTFPMPVEVADGDRRVKVTMANGAGSIPWSGGEPDLDPDGWILRETAPDPDRFGTIGRGTAPIPYRRQDEG